MPLILWVPLFGFPTLLAVGWSLDAIRRRACGEAEQLPQPNDLGSILKVGLVVLVMAVMYLVVPVLLLAWVLEVAWWQHLLQIFDVLWAAFRGHPHPDFATLLWNKTLTLLSDSLVPLIYLLIAAPVFTVARLRYALTGRISSFFRPWGTLRICSANAGQLLTYFFIASLLRLATSILTGFLALTLVGIPLLIVPAVLSGISIWMLVYFVAPLASSTLAYEKQRTFKDSAVRA